VIVSARPIIISFAGDSWDGNPHSRHHLMRRLAPRYDVLFVEGVPMRGPAVRDRYELRRIAAKLGPPRRLRTVGPGLHVFRPAPVPPAGRLGRAAQLAALRLEIRHAIARLELHGPRLSWFSQPIVSPLLGRLGERASVLYYQDRYDAFAFVDGPRIRSHLARLARNCDLSIATAEPLARELRALGADPVLLLHGVDVERFATPSPAPADLAALERPLVGFVGLIDTHVDVEAILAVASSLQRGTVVLIGGTNIDPQPLRRDRIALLGPRAYELIPAYLHAFDVCIMPFRINRLTEAVNPIKLREYLSAGRPTVATPLPATAPYASGLELATGPKEFPAAVATALAATQDSEPARALRRRLVANDSWDIVASRLETLLEGVLRCAARR
jgi:glycosyltransferase involved in cell wall biosynthesis